MSIVDEVVTFLVATERDKYPVRKPIPSADLTNREQAMCRKIDFDPEDAAFLKRITLSPLQLLEFGYDDDNLAIGIFGVTKEENARTVIREHQDRFLEAGKYLFIGERYFDGCQLAIAHTCTDPFRIMELACTNGDSYCMMTDDLVAKVREWHKRFGIRIKGIGYNFCEAEILDRNIDYRSLSEEVGAFCPGAFSQHISSLEEEIRSTGTIRIHWDWNDAHVSSRAHLKVRSVPVPVAAPRANVMQQLAQAWSSFQYRLLHRGMAASSISQ